MILVVGILVLLFSFFAITSNTNCFFCYKDIAAWKKDTAARYCLMKNELDEKTLLNKTHENVIALLGNPTYEIYNTDSTQSMMFQTNEGAWIGWFYLVVTLKNDRVVSLSEMLD